MHARNCQLRVLRRLLVYKVLTSEHSYRITTLHSGFRKMDSELEPIMAIMELCRHVMSPVSTSLSFTYMQFPISLPASCLSQIRLKSRDGKRGHRDGRRGHCVARVQQPYLLIVHVRGKEGLGEALSWQPPYPVSPERCSGAQWSGEGSQTALTLEQSLV